MQERITLRSDRRTLVLDGTLWKWILELCELLFWRPLGTYPPESYPADSAWDGNYMHPCGQVIAWSDGWNLANTLNRGLSTLEALVPADTAAQLRRLTRFFRTARAHTCVEKTPRDRRGGTVNFPLLRGRQYPLHRHG